ncbi:MAG: DUF1428 domain-containing protein [Verrucomicrobiota bacterium]
MSTYTDGFVLSIPKGKLDQYTALATKAAEIWREHGALEYRECAGDDMDAKDMVSFPDMAKTNPDEIVIFAWATFKSREHRDEVNAKIMADPRMASMCEQSGVVFDCSRMAYGGFKTIVSL